MKDNKLKLNGLIIFFLIIYILGRVNVQRVQWENINGATLPISLLEQGVAWRLRSSGYFIFCHVKLFSGVLNSVFKTDPHHIYYLL